MLSFPLATCAVTVKVPVDYTVTESEWTAALETFVEESTNYTMTFFFGEDGATHKFTENIGFAEEVQHGETYSGYIVKREGGVEMYMYDPQSKQWVSSGLNNQNGETSDMRYEDYLSADKDLVEQFDLGTQYKDMQYDSKTGTYRSEKDGTQIVVGFENKQLSYISIKDEEMSCEVTDIGTTKLDVPFEVDHTFAETWSSDNVYHWHAATCHEGVVDERIAHTFADGKCTVCNYAQKEVSNEVTEEQWRAAFKFDGIYSQTYECIDSYGNGFDHVRTMWQHNAVYTEAWEGDGEKQTLLGYTQNGKGYRDITIDGKRYFQYDNYISRNIKMAQKFLSMLQPLADMFSQFTLQPDGSYIASGIAINFNDTYPYWDLESEVKVVFDDGNIVSLLLTAEDKTLSVTDIGATVITIPQLPLHEHNYVFLTNSDPGEHYFACVCGARAFYSHSDGETCDVCGRKSGDPYIYEHATLNGKEGWILSTPEMDEIWIPQVTEFCGEPIIAINIKGDFNGVVVPSNLAPCFPDTVYRTSLYWEGTEAQLEAHLDTIRQYLIQQGANLSPDPEEDLKTIFSKYMITVYYYSTEETEGGWHWNDDHTAPVLW